MLKTRITPLLIALFMVFGLSASANAVNFSVLSGNATLGLGTGTGAGTEGDPIMIYETITAGGPVELHLTQTGTGNEGDSIHQWGRWFEKVVTNNTADTWTSFEFELHDTLGTPSGDGDGLSFAQGYLPRPFSSNVYGSWTEEILLKDYANFFDGSVAPGGSVSFMFYVTFMDNNDFYLVQNPNEPVPGRVPEPSTILLLGSGLMGLGYFSRRKRG